MAERTYVFNVFLEMQADGTNDFSIHSYKAALMDSSYMPNIDSDESWTDVSGDEVTVATGYTAGGGTLANVLITRNDQTNIVSITWDTYKWDIPYGAQLSGIKGVMVYNDSLASKPLIEFFEFANVMTVPQENSFVTTPVIQFKNGGA